ncbi:MAG: PAC2 family protein [Nanoarchaeota archaeon]
MKIVTKYVPKSPTVIMGFPGFGLVGTICTEFLIDHLKAEQIGEFVYDELPATVAIHKTKLIMPMAIFYDKRNNIVVLHTILNTKGYEWQITDIIVDFLKKTKAKEVISLEGVGSMSGEEDTKIYSYNNPALVKLGAVPVEESIIIGVTSAMMLRYPDTTCIFAGTHSQLPDSKAAAFVIALLDKYLGLKVDYEPLIKQAQEFETKIKGILADTVKTSDEAEKKNMSYLG